MTILEVRDVYKRFGGITALEGVSIKIEGEEVVGLIGPNGSGKTTLFNAVVGFYPIDKGDIYFDGENITGLKPHQTAQKGIGRTFQITRVFPRMTVLENMLVAPKDQVGEGLFPTFLRWREVRRQEIGMVRKAEAILKFLEIDGLKDEFAGNLSGGQRKLLELGRVLMTDPKMILLDEPVAGVNPTLANKIFDRILELREQEGLTFLIVEHNMDVMMEACDRVYVMNKGRIVAEGVPEEIQSDERVIEAYLGG